MSIKATLITKLDQVLRMNNEFLQVISKEDLKLRLPGSRSNTIGSQIVCLARARDAYSKSILNDEGFQWRPDYPYADRYKQDQMAKHLETYNGGFIKHLKGLNDLSDNQVDLIVDLIGHEYLHQGQLIRYIYAHDLKMPPTPKAFWHLED